MTAPEVTLIDYGVGNLLSVQRALEHCGAKVILTSNPVQILAASRVVLPGVGAFAKAMEALQELGLVDALRELADRQIPLLGICLGMQLLFEQSEEFGLTRGLGFIPGYVIPIPAVSLAGQRQKIPHVGWSALYPSSGLDNWEGTLLQDISSGEATYFVHSYMAVPDNITHSIAETQYGGHKICAVTKRDQITGCQFHPEKSGSVGLEILRNFVLR